MLHVVATADGENPEMITNHDAHRDKKEKTGERRFIKRKEQDPSISITIELRLGAVVSRLCMHIIHAHEHVLFRALFNRFFSLILPVSFDRFLFFFFFSFPSSFGDAGVDPSDPFLRN